MDNISEEANTSEMRPDQIPNGIGNQLEEPENPFSITLKKTVDNDNDDDLSFFGVGGPA